MLYQCQDCGNKFEGIIPQHPHDPNAAFRYSRMGCPECQRLALMPKVCPKCGSIKTALYVNVDVS